MIASAQLSVYPLRQERLGPAIETVRRVLEGCGLEPQVGPMSTIVTGEYQMLFAALGEAFAAVAHEGDVVMTVTVSNACPVAGPP